ncbi:MAG TPA: hypothetical protein VFI03_03935, partial [Solirubrobacterales bacterium]|nr:hypothetical protein [Solirubrobacterales bacterium]
MPIVQESDQFPDHHFDSAWTPTSTVTQLPDPGTSAMASENRQRIDLRLVKALAHPLRHDILEVLAVEVASPTELSDKLSTGLSDVAYHVRVLDRCGCLELVDTAPRRGATEHFYRALPKTSISHPAWRRVPRALLGDVTLHGFQHFARNLMAALKAGTIGTYD